jgi:RNA polymerase sigma factor (sigma-70 family)
MTATESAHRGEFFKNNYRALLGFVRQLIDDSADRDGEDIVQEVMLNLFDKADVVEPVQNLTGYLYASLRNRIIDIMRARKKTLSLDAENGEDNGLSLKDVLRDDQGDALHSLEEKDRRKALYEAIDALSDDEKAVVVATEFDDRSFKDLAEEWETPMGTLLSRKSRAIKHIGDFLRERGFDKH